MGWGGDSRNLSSKVRVRHSLYSLFNENLRFYVSEIIMSDLVVLF